jgi:hypothetical protein
LRAAEDLVFFERLALSGLPVHYCPSARIQWTLPSSPSAFFRRLRLYSAHHIRAGLFRTWHARVMLMDIVMAVVLACTALTLWAAPCLLTLAGGRLLATVKRRRGNVPDGAAYRADRLVRVAFLLLLADLGTWAGALDWLRTRGRE